MYHIKPEVVAAWHQMGEVLQRVTRQISELFSNAFKPNRLSGSTTENPNIYKPLKLNLQFFAEGDPPQKDGYYATLKEAFKANPHLHTEHKAAITEAVSDRFKKYDFDADEAKAALAEKAQREKDKAEGKDSESVEVRKLQERNSKLEAKTKKLALESVTGDAEQAKLISRLASDKVAELKLNDDFELDKDAVNGIVGELREEFPNLFPVADDPTGGTDQQQQPDQSQQQQQAAGTRTGGTAQRTNTPPGKDVDAAAEVAQIFEHLKKQKRV